MAILTRAREARVVGILLWLGSSAAFADTPPRPNPLPPEVVRLCNLAQTFCAVSDPRLPLLKVMRAGQQTALWTLPLHATHFLVSNGGGTVAVFAPAQAHARAETPFLTLYRQNGTKVEFGYWSLYGNLLQTPDVSFPLRWGSVVAISGDDEFAIRSVRGETFKFSMKDED